MVPIQVTVNGRPFAAVLYESDTTQEWVRQFPMALSMEEWNGNGFYAVAPSPLPQDGRIPSRIRPGDLMLYGSSRIALFYEGLCAGDFYTPLGYLLHTEGLADALGEKAALVTFSLRGAEVEAAMGIAACQRQTFCARQGHIL